jgi:hypothetical protein
MAWLANTLNRCPLLGVKRTFTTAIPGPSGVLL